ncbi:MAG: transcriptional regulator CynR [Chloroflexi bacterium]|nr:transcriptional regulator CynR [Chloroflexota bacterium]
MELRQLRYLRTIAQEASFTRAAERSFVSQSALSQQMQALEQEVGTRLLDRSKRGVHLTAAGTILVEHADRMLLELEQATVAIRELEGLQRGELRIGVVQTVNDYLMPGLVARFAASHPRVRLTIEESATDAIERRLGRGELQLGVGFLPASDPDIETEPLFEEELALVVRDDHHLVGERSVPVRSLDGLPMVMLSDTFCTRRLWEENARLAGAQPRVTMELNTVNGILAVVERTGLTTVLPHRTLAAGRAQRLVALELRDPTPSRTVGLLWRRDHHRCAATRAFMEVARDRPVGLRGH